MLWFAALKSWGPEVRTVCGSGSHMLTAGPQIRMAAAPSRDRPYMMWLVLMDVDGKEPGETTISMACFPFPVLRCPSSVPVSASGCVCVWSALGDLSTHGTPDCILGHLGYHAVMWRSLLCYFYYLFVPFSSTVTVSPSSYRIQQFFRSFPFPRMYISPRHGFTKLSSSAFDQSLFAWFLPSDWWLTFLLV